MLTEGLGQPCRYLAMIAYILYQFCWPGSQIIFMSEYTLTEGKECHYEQST